MTYRSAAPHQKGRPSPRKAPVQNKPLGKIEDWLILKTPEGRKLFGRVVEHPYLAGFDHNRFQITSPVRRVDMRLGTVETNNTIYRLGVPLFHWH